MTNNVTLVEINTQGLDGDLNDNFNALKDAVNAKVSTVPADTTIYVATTGSDTTGDGSSSAPYATLTKALSYLNGKMLLGAVTIQLANGTYSHTSRIEPNHPQGGLITIQGNTSDKTLVTLNFSGCWGFFLAPNLALTLKYLTISGNRTSGNYGFFSTGFLTLNNCKIMNFYTGIVQQIGTADLRTVEITNNLYNGLDAFPQSYIYTNNLTSTYNGSCGVNAHQTGSVVIDSGTITNNAWGFSASYQGQINANNVTINSNTAGAMYAANLGLITTDAATTYSGTVTPAINTQGNNGSYILH